MQIEASFYERGEVAGVVAMTRLALIRRLLH
jgi:hypothetical protein